MGTDIQLPERYNMATTFIDEPARRRPDRVAIYYGDQALTYRELQELVNRTGNALRGLGVEVEDRVLLIVLDCPEFVAAFFGAIKIGAIPVPINTLMRASDFEYFLRDSRAKVLVVSEPLLPELEKVDRRALRDLKHVVVIGTPRPGDRCFADLVKSASAELEAADTSRDEMAFWLYSSGSTGLPKGVVHLQHDAIWCAELYFKNILGINERDIVFSVAKLFFAYGLGNCLYATLQEGAACVLLPDRPTPEKVFEVIDRYQPTVFYAVPTMYAALLQVKDAERGYRTGSLRLCVSAGEALPPRLYQEWRDRFGTEILDGIGSTEICHIFISNRPGRVRPGASGLLVEGYEARIVEEDGQPVPRGEVGNLWIKGESIAPFYWNKHQKTKQTMLGEWIVTGDKYYQDEDGSYWYAGRADDMLKVGGIWVSPVEVENTLVGHPAVLECAVVGAEDEEQLVKPKAFVVLRQGQTASPALAEELQAFVKDKIAPYKYPRWIEFVPELPKTATGKIQRFRLRQG
ncbi:MAG: benzoate-CoA ligase family protein [Deltaproteobacteria bacterium]|nr:benzoate-CoA ligase family protein [Deltaproteobacteria bacterium]